MLERKNVERVLKDFGRNVDDKSNRRFKGRDKVRHELSVFPNSFSLEFRMEQHMEFQDKGVRGKKSSLKAPKSPYRYGTGNFKGTWGLFRLSISSWMIRKGIAPRDERGRFLSRDSIIHAITTSIYNTGLKPKLFFSKSFEEEYKNLPDDIIEAYGLDIRDFMKSTLKTTTR